MNQFNAGLLLLGAGCIVACGAHTDETNRGEIGESGEQLQIDYDFNGYAQVVANTTSAQSRSTAAIRAMNIDANTNHASCGATFVSEHYAVTAAHCLFHVTLDTENIIVEEITTSNLNAFGLYFGSSIVTGNWPNWNQGSPLGWWDGYTSSTMNCRVRRRCLDTPSPSQPDSQSCPAGVGDVDIALIECPARSSSDWATTTSINTVNRAVEVWWFHEILNLTTTPDESDQYWMHYGNYPSPSNRNDNYHYREYHQLFPIRSTGRPRPFNTPLNYKDVSNSGAYSGMDTPICHGTSGSGVFLNGQNVLIGPTISGGPSWTDSNGNSRPALCHQMDEVPAGQMASSHVRSAVTHQFVTGSPEVMADR